MDPRTPVLVGAGAVTQREEDPRAAKETVELMVTALERAADDAGTRELLARADSIRTARGFWGYPDPCRLIAERFGAAGARTSVSEIGILQTSLFGRAAEEISSGAADVVLVTGGEASYRALRARITDTEVPETEQLGVAPDEVIRPAAEIIHPLELERGLSMPVNQYAVIETALRYAEGVSIEAHRDEVAALYARLAAVAAGNPLAWNRSGVDARTIRDAVDGNRMLAFPYTKLHTSQWHVDQAAGLILCSVAVARELGISRDRWVFPLAVADSNHMVSLAARRAIDHCPGFAHAGARALEVAGRSTRDVAHAELYSCFPSAVRIQMRELAMEPDREVSVTGGMAFGGGPLNNFVLQATAEMARVLRADPGSLGLVTAVSGYLTKQGVSLWSTEPAEREFEHVDVSEEVARDTPTVEVVADVQGRATVASYTVVFERDGSARTVLLCDLPGDRRTIVSTHDAQVAELATEEELCGRPVRIGSDTRIDIY